MKLALVLGGLALIAAAISAWCARVAQDEQSRTSATRELLEKLAAEMKADGTPPPSVRYRLPDGREQMQGKVRLTNWQVHQARVQARLRKRA